MKVVVATARKAAAVAALLAAVALLALRQAAAADRKAAGKAVAGAAGPVYDLADGKGRVLTGRRLRMMAYLLRLPVVGAVMCRLMAKGKRGMAVRRFASRLPDNPLYYPYIEPDATRSITNTSTETILLPEDCPTLSSFAQRTLQEREGNCTTVSFRHWTIADYTSRYAALQVTPTQVIETVLHEIAANEKGSVPLKLFIEIHESESMKYARESTERYARGEPLGVLDGVPIAVKDTMDVRGFRTWAGTSFMGDILGAATEDAIPVARLRAAGAIIIGKTNMHELGAGVTGFNAHHGTVRNPYNPKCYTGGSSSGSAAAVAFGIVPLAVGQDGGGSTRVPAALCGVVGIKPTFQRVPPLSSGSPSLSHTGPIAGCVRDAAIGYAIMSGADSSSFPRGISQPPVDLRTFDDTQSLAGVRVAYFPRYNDHSSPEVAASTRDVLQALEKLGCELIEVELPHLAPIHMAHSITIASEFALMIDKVVESMGKDGLTHSSIIDKLSPEAQMVLTMADQCSSKDFVAAQRVRAFALRQFQEQVLSCADVFVTPMVGITAPDIPQEAFSSGEVNAKQQAAIVRYSWYSNMIGTPAITVPTSLDSRGLPMAVQFQTAHWNEDLMLRLAHAVEKMYSREQRRPKAYVSILGSADA